TTSGSCCGSRPSTYPVSSRYWVPSSSVIIPRGGRGPSRKAGGWVTSPDPQTTQAVRLGSLRGPSGQRSQSTVGRAPRPIGAVARGSRVGGGGAETLAGGGVTSAGTIDALTTDGPAQDGAGAASPDSGVVGVGIQP